MTVASNKFDSRARTALLILVLILLGGLVVCGYLRRYDFKVTVLLLQATRHPDPDSRARAIDELCRIGRMRRKLCVSSVVRIVSGLTCVLDTDRSADNRKRAADALGWLGPEAYTAMPELCRAVRMDPSAKVRSQAATALHCLAQPGTPQLDYEHALQTLLDAVASDRNSRVRSGCAEALGAFGSAELIEKRARLRGADSERRWAFPHSVVVRLIDRLDRDEDEGVRASAAFALGCIGHRACIAVPCLEQAGRNDKDAHVRKCAEESLVSIREMSGRKEDSGADGD